MHGVSILAARVDRRRRAKQNKEVSARKPECKQGKEERAGEMARRPGGSRLDRWLLADLQIAASVLQRA